ncbi:MAG: alpha/beta hydrolase [Candidatus Woesearchaeota archaeon]
MKELITTKQGIKVSTTYLKGDKTKKTFVFIHGNAQNETSGKVLLDFFHSKGHSVLSYDLPGHGNSEPYPNDDVGMEDFAETLKETLEHYNITNPIIAGHSMGGMILLQFAVKYPEFASKLILIDASDIDPVKTNKLILLKDIIPQIIENCGKAFEKRFKYDFSSSTEINEENILDIGFKYTDSASLRANFKATFDYDVSAKLELLKMPVLILRGEDDFLMTEEMTLDMYNRINNSKFVQVEGGHNWIVLKDKEEVRKVFEDNYCFLA